MGKDKKRSKRHKFNKKKDEFETYEKKLSKHGQTDSNFIDTSFQVSSYPWTTIEHVLDPPKIKKLKSLKYLCANQISLNCSNINESLLKSLPWSIWRPVWNCILRNGKDTIEIFIKFNNVFGLRSDFKNHKTRSFINKRDEAVLLNSIPNGNKHRIETIFNNVPIVDVVSKLNSTMSKIVLDLSHLKEFKREDYFMLFNISSLICLDLSNHQVDDSFLSNLRTSIYHGKLNKLIMMKLVNTKITNTGILNFLELDSNIKCIETNIMIKKEGWLLMKPQAQYHLTLGLYVLQDMFPDFNFSSPNIIDLMIINKSYPAPLDLLWSTRNKISARGYVYVRDPNFKPNTKVEEEEEVPQPKKRQKLKINANEFFSI
ncbi:hypothetical protein KGF54_000117 [Candida jiufengensis]|uniref:uncharacterized protein n=1 Tax=Candida jiufengensis TaxID=497108 RepID=UPI00222453BF|nr:uncharacterized protein KGF54_000117 [Candida jiufengensis]KAI5957189.1 hypothetical protein KGF54_000117 [Candida jiufengensis]